jgi:small subunit ribosomal protein S18
MNKYRQRPKRTIRKPGVCYYCKQKITPDYKDLETIRKFVTERGKIVGRMHSGVCQKHQKQLSQSVKRARFLALLPFLVRPQ